MVAGRLIAALLGLALAWSGQPGHAVPPARVVSVNLCTDQLALMLAAPGQLVSVSYLARDPRVSVMALAAATVPTNRGDAEGVFVLRPDLVLAGAYTPPGVLRLLATLGVPVEIFPAETDLQDIRDNLRQMGRVLGREAEAERIIAEFDAGLAGLAPKSGPDPDALIYGANGYVAGRDSLAGAILDAAGYHNLATDLGIAQGGVLPLEQVLLADPDLLVLASPGPGPARSEAILDHPALRTHAERHRHEIVRDRDWSCGTPQILDPIRSLRALRSHQPEAAP